MEPTESTAFPTSTGIPFKSERRLSEHWLVTKTNPYSGNKSDTTWSPRNSVPDDARESNNLALEVCDSSDAATMLEAVSMVSRSWTESLNTSTFSYENYLNQDSKVDSQLSKIDAIDEFQRMHHEDMDTSVDLVDEEGDSSGELLELDPLIDTTWNESECNWPTDEGTWSFLLKEKQQCSSSSQDEFHLPTNRLDNESDIGEDDENEDEEEEEMESFISTVLPPLSAWCPPQNAKSQSRLRRVSRARNAPQRYLTHAREKLRQILQMVQAPETVEEETKQQRRLAALEGLD
jgi:hypothetical protein